MEYDELQHTLIQVQEWLNERTLMGVEVHVFERKTMPNALWKRSDEVSWQPFLEAAQELGVNLIWIETQRCNLEDETDELAGLLSLAEEENRLEVAAKLDLLKQYNNFIASYRLYWAYGGVLNAYIEEAAWASDYFDCIRGIQELRKRANQQERAVGFQKSRKSERRQNLERARILLKHPKYASCKNRNDRQYLAREIFGEDVNTRAIVYQAETLSRMESA